MGGLHAAHGEPSAEPLGGEPGFVHAEAGVRHLPRVGGPARVAALPVGDQPLERLPDVLLDVVVHVDAQHLALVAEVVQEFVHDELALVVRVARVDHAVRAVQQAPDALHQIILALGGLLRPVRDQDGQRVDAPRLTPLPVHMLRLHQFQQMPGTGDHRVPVAADGQWGGLRHLPCRTWRGRCPDPASASPRSPACIPCHFSFPSLGFTARPRQFSVIAFSKSNLSSCGRSDCSDARIP